MTVKYIELARQIAELQKQAETAKAKERAEEITRIKEVIALYGITAGDLGLGTQGSKTQVERSTKTTSQSAPAAAYKDAAGNTWSGRGPRPKWLKEALANGATLEGLRAN